MNKRLAIVMLMCSMLLVPLVHAEGRSIRVIGRSKMTVSTPHIRLGDVATIHSRRPEDNDVIIGLKKLVIDPAPKPGQETTLSATTILQRMQEQGVRLNDIGYRFPRVMTVTRAGRNITEFEISSVIEDSIARSGKDIQLRSVSVPDIMIAPGDVTFVVSPSGSRQAGQMTFRVTAKVPDEEDIRFRVRANVDQWLEVPVAKRGIRLGERIQPDDLMMARFHVRELPTDAARRPDEIIGFASKGTINHGDVFQRRRLEIPPVIRSGDRVVLQFRSRFLEATATGTALEDGGDNEMIRVRNVASKKVILGKVITSGLVRVSE